MGQASAGVHQHDRTVYMHDYHAERAKPDSDVDDALLDPSRSTDYRVLRGIRDQQA